MQGFVLDGFPRTREHAVLFEKAFSGLDLEGEAAYAASASLIAPPATPALPPPHRPLTSCLDTAVILELDDPELSIERAIGQRLDPESGQTFHMRFAPPPEDDPGLLERLVPAHSGSNDAEQVRTRMEAYLETAPALAQWLGRFRTLAHRIDSDRPVTELKESVLAIAKTVEDCKAGATVCRTAAHAAASARANAEAAAEAARAAGAAAAAAARELLLAKTAELEAQKVLARPPEHAKGAKKGKVDPAEEAAAAEAAASATRVLAAEAATRCAEHLRAGNAAKENAEQQLAAAQQSAAAAQEAAARARRFQSDASRSADAEACATAAADAAAEAAAGAQAAQEQAAVAARQAAAVVAKAQGKVEGASEGDTLDLSSDDGAAATPAAAIADSEAPAPEATLSADAAQYLAALWESAEGAFVRGVRSAFGGVRDVRASVVEHCGRSRADVEAQLARPDGQQAELTAFVAACNRTDADMLRLPDVQAELVLRADELQERLWAMCDAKHAADVAVAAKVTDDAFGRSAAAALASHFVAVLQADADRFAAVSCFALDYCALSAGEALPTRAVSLTDLTVKPSGDLAPLLDAKTGVPAPEWLAASAAPAAVQQAARVALAAIALQERATALVGADAGDKKKAAKGKGAAAAAALPTAEESAAADRVRTAAAPMLAREREIAMARVRATVARAAAHDGEVVAVLTACAGRLRDAISERHTNECERVASAVATIKDAIASSSKVAHDLILGANAVCVDLGTALFPLQPAKQEGPMLVVERGTGTLELAHVHELLERVLESTHHVHMPTAQLAELLQRAAAALSEQPLPPRWPQATHKQMHDALQRFDAHESGYLDWRHVLCSLLLHAMPRIQQAGAADFAAAAEALQDACGARVGGVTEAEWLACRLWFEREDKVPGCDRDLEADSAAAEPVGADAAMAYTRDAALFKRLLWRMFCGRGAWHTAAGSAACAEQAPLDSTAADSAAEADCSEGELLMDPQVPLLYLAADTERVLAVRKAYAVLTRNASRKAALPHAELCKLLYPAGTKAGADLCKVPYSTEDVRAMVADVGRKAEHAADVAVTAEQLVYSVPGARLLTACAPHLELRDLYLDLWRVKPVPASE